MKRLLSLFLLCLCTAFYADATLYNFPEETEEDGSIFPLKDWGFSMAGPRTSGDVDVFITADFIYWGANETGLDFAVVNGSTSGSPNMPQGQILRPDMTWNPGAIVGIGLNLPHDGWDVYGQYTWYQAKSGNNIYELNALAMLPISGALENGVVVAERCSWNLRYNDVTLDMYRNTFFSKHLALAPSIGLAGHWQDQLYQVFYTQPESEGGQITRNRAFQKVTGIGVRAGAEASFFIGCGFSVAGNFYGSALWTRFRNTFTTSEIVPPISFTTPDIGNTFINNYEAWNQILPVASSLLALRWERWFQKRAFHMRLQLGWQERIYFGLNELLPPTWRQGAGGGNLSLGGVDFQIRLGF